MAYKKRGAAAPFYMSEVEVLQRRVIGGIVHRRGGNQRACTLVEPVSPADSPHPILRCKNNENVEVVIVGGKKKVAVGLVQAGEGPPRRAPPAPQGGDLILESVERIRNRRHHNLHVKSKSLRHHATGTIGYPMPKTSLSVKENELFTLQIHFTTPHKNTLEL